MVISVIGLYKILKTKFSDQEAEAIIAGLDEKINHRFDDWKNDFSTKDDITKLELKIAALDVKMAENKSEIIKWMFIFLISQLASFIALAKFFFSK